MADADERSLLIDYVQSGKVMQVATLTEAGTPMLCHVWYASAFQPDRLWWLSRPERKHSENIRRRPAVAGGVVAIDLDELGKTIPRGVTFEGRARELPIEGISEEAAGFVARWPAAATSLDPEKLARGEAPHRLYELEVTSWVLFDEENFPDQPRRPVPVA